MLMLLVGITREQNLRAQCHILAIRRSAGAKAFCKLLSMKRLLPILLVMVCEGCVTSEHNWNLGKLREDDEGVYGSIVIIPKSIAGVMLMARIEKVTLEVPSVDLHFRIRNEENHVIEIQGRDPFVHLQPGESFELLARRGSGGWIVCFLDTGSGRVKLRVDIVGGRPKESDIRMVAHASDAL